VLVQMLEQMLEPNRLSSALIGGRNPAGNVMATHVHNITNGKAHPSVPNCETQGEHAIFKKRYIRAV